jgi:hypothetical protein
LESIFERYKEIITYDLDSRSNVFNGAPKIETFLERFYEKRNEESTEKIKARITNDKTIISFEGVQGCGKSTTAQILLDDIKKNKYNNKNYDYIRIDFNVLKSQLFENDENKIKKKLDEILKNRIRDKYFENRDHDLYTALLIEEYPDVDSFSNFLTYKREFNRKFIRNCKHNGTSDKSTYLSNFIRESVDFINRLDEEIDFKHYIIIGKIKNIFSNENVPLEKIIILLDNVDILDHVQQRAFFQYALDNATSLQSYSKLLITIRPENAYAHQYMGGFSNYINRIFFREEDKEEFTYLSPIEFNLILSRRIDYFWMEIAPKEFKDADVLIQTIIELKNKMLNTHAEANLIGIANQSIRAALSYHCDFLEYLIFTVGLIYIKLNDKKRYNRFINEQTFINSVFYGWVAEKNDLLSKQNLNICKIVNLCEIQGYKIKGCDLGYLILANLERHKVKGSSTIQINKLLEGLRKLNYTDDEILAKLNELKENDNKDFGGVINIFCEKYNRYIDIKNINDVVSLNDRGKYLIDKVSISFTFNVKHVYDCGKNHNVEYLEKEDDLLPEYQKYSFFMKKAKSDDLFTFYDYDGYGELLLNSIYLYARIAKLHCRELIKICRYYNKSEWYSEYKNDFCINDKLQLIRILDSACFHFDSLSTNKQFNDDEKHVISNAKKIVELMKILYEHQIEQITVTTRKIIAFKSFFSASEILLMLTDCKDIPSSVEDCGVIIRENV